MSEMCPIHGERMHFREGQEMYACASCEPAIVGVPEGVSGPEHEVKAQYRRLGYRQGIADAAKLIDGESGQLRWLVDKVLALYESVSGPEQGAAGGEPNPLDVIALARVAARRKGYALAVHGSLSRDLDLVAVPWSEQAVEPAEVVEAIRKSVGGWLVVADPNGRDGYYTMDDETKRSPIERPHGRAGWIIFGVLGGSYIDLSVMPLRAALRSAPPGSQT